MTSPSDAVLVAELVRRGVFARVARQWNGDEPLPDVIDVDELAAQFT